MPADCLRHTHTHGMWNALNPGPSRSKGRVNWNSSRDFVTRKSSTKSLEHEFAEINLNNKDKSNKAKKPVEKISLQMYDYDKVEIEILEFKYMSTNQVAYGYYFSAGKMW